MSASTTATDEGKGKRKHVSENLRDPGDAEDSVYSNASRGNRNTWRPAGCSGFILYDLARFHKRGGKIWRGGAFQKAYGTALSGSLLWHLTARRDQRLLSNKLSLASRSGTGTCRPVGGASRHLRQLSVKAHREAASPKFYSPIQPLFFFLIPDSPPPALLTLVLDRFIEPVSRCEQLTPLR